jgi:hypothetical protein
VIYTYLINSRLQIANLFRQNLKRSPKGTKTVEICHVLSRDFLRLHSLRPHVHRHSAEMQRAFFGARSALTPNDFGGDNNQREKR